MLRSTTQDARSSELRIDFPFWYARILPCFLRFSMIIVLEQDYIHLGKAGELIEVKRGYAMNFLIPEGIASVADEARLMKLKAELQKKESQKQAIIEKAGKIQKTIEGKTLTITKKVTTKGTLYGSVSAKEVAEVLEKDFDVQLDQEMLTIPHVKTLGEYQIDVVITPENTFQFTLNVTKQV